jgi:hypothetical protein
MDVGRLGVDVPKWVVMSRARRRREVIGVLRVQERAADDARLDAESTKRDESKSFGFLQKYYHR